MFIVTNNFKPNAVSVLAHWNLETTAIRDAKYRGNGAVVREVKPEYKTIDDCPIVWQEKK